MMQWILMLFQNWKKLQNCKGLLYLQNLFQQYRLLLMSTNQAMSSHP